MPVTAYHEPYLHEAVQSILAQTSPDWRLLVITAKTQRAEMERVLAPYLDDPRIGLIGVAKGRIAVSFNAGMRAAETEFVTVLFGDDLWTPRAAEVLTRATVSKPHADVFHSSRRYIDDRGRPISSVYRSRPTVRASDFLTDAPVKHLLCWRRAKGLAVGGFDESLGSVGVDDFDFPWTMAEQGAVFEAVPECLYVVRDHRQTFRLTTHLTLSHHKRELGRIMAKHGADRVTIEARVARAERTYLRQCLYRSRADKWIQTLRGHDPQVGWREPYR
jgi:Glycosyl transferase family 2